MRLIVIDPHVTQKSPSMRAWLSAFSVWRNLFDEVEVWSAECDEELQKHVKWVKVPLLLPTWRLQALEFKHRVQNMVKALPVDQNRILQVTGTNVFPAEIRYIHFWNQALLEECARHSENLKMSLLEKIPAKNVALTEQYAVQYGSKNDFWFVVSRSLAEKIQADGAKGNFRILPNQYRPETFHLAARRKYREEMRKHYGFSPREKVLVFSAFGHFERKGLRQAVQAVNILVEKGEKMKLLVLGGTAVTLKKFREALHVSKITEVNCLFAGLVSEIEKHLAAADGFIFPSHFEAFSLSEIEAAALGLRLYLTPHYGSEMILREPVNGRFLPWDAEGMARVIADDIAQGLFGKEHAELGEAVEPASYAAMLRGFYEEVIATKQHA